MLTFWIIAALFILLALWFVLPPLLQKVANNQGDDMRAANVLIYKDQLQEMAADLKSGLMTEEQYQQDKELIAKKADELEKKAQTHLRTHEVLASSVTMFQIAIAVGAISVLIRSRPFWLISLALGVVGIAFLIQSFFTVGSH